MSESLLSDIALFTGSLTDSIISLSVGGGGGGGGGAAKISSFSNGVSHCTTFS